MSGRRGRPKPYDKCCLHYIPEKDEGADTLKATKALNRNLSENDKKDVRDFIWKVDVSGLKGGLGTITTQATKQDSSLGWRVDRQNPPSGYVNIQVQKNGADNPSTVACVLVPTRLLDGLGKGGRAHELSWAFRGGMLRSLNSHRLGQVGHQPAYVITVHKVVGNYTIRNLSEANLQEH